MSPQPEAEQSDDNERRLSHIIVEFDRLKQKLRTRRVYQLIRNYLDDDADGLASMIAFGTLFSLMPIIMFTFLILSTLMQIGDFRVEAAGLFADDLPPAVADPVREVVDKGSANIAGLGFATIFTLLFGGSRLYNALDRAFARIYRTERRGHFKRKFFATLMMVITPFSLLVVTAIAGTTTALVLEPVDKLIDVDPDRSQLVTSYLVSFALAFIMMLLAYGLIPSAGPGIRRSKLGSAVAAILLILLAQLYPIYIEISQGYSLYGSVVSLILVVMYWLYLVGQIVVIGAEINAFRSGWRAGELE